MATKLTSNEATLLRAIRDSEYHDGADSVIDNPIWCDEIGDASGLGTSVGGVMASLVCKGLAWTDGECCAITEAGFAAVA